MTFKLRVSSFTERRAQILREQYTGTLIVDLYRTVIAAMEQALRDGDSANSVITFPRKGESNR